ncbi:hypothetical protein HYY69_02830 [Candidatus Woesearchaeota archaeon]|nr:hypothetical protein [Candidatus Woesearchaeota archaeon]
MIDAQLELKVKNYIRSQYEKGHTFDVIETTLIDHGYPKDFVKGLIKNSVRNYEYSHVLKSPAQITLGVILIIMVIGFFFYLRSNIPKTCDTKECFLERVQDCQATKYMHQGDKLTYELVTDKRCMLTKKVIAVADTEPGQVKTLLLDKSMDCSYERNAFNEQYLTTMLGGIQTCTGPLKEAFYEVLISVYNQAK